MKLKSQFFAFLLPLLTVFTACGHDLHSESLKIGVLNQTYYDTFYVEEEGWTWGDDTVLAVTSGSLPTGLYLTSSGEIIGTPTSVGDFEFRVTAYSFSYSFDDDDDVDRDSETYDLFVTEASTNGNCPSPDNESLNDTYYCLGDLTYDTLAAGTAIDLDMNLFVSFEYGEEYEFTALDFSVFYDPAQFEPIESELTSQILREAATRTGAIVTFSEPAAGELRISVTVSENTLHKSGRLMDLPFQAVQNVPAGEYPFEIVFNAVTTSNTEVALPSTYEIDGKVSVTADVEVETEETETTEGEEPH